MGKAEVQEQRFLQKRSDKSECITPNPETGGERYRRNFQKHWTPLFAKAFALIFEKGTGVVKDVSADKTGAGLSGASSIAGGCKAEFENPSALFSKKARDTGEQKIYCYPVCLESGWAYLGIGLPDIPVRDDFKRIFMRLLCSMDTTMKAGEEKYFILLIRGAVSYGGCTL